MKKYLSLVFFLAVATFAPAQAQNLLPQANLDLFPSVVRVGEFLEYDASASRDSQGQTNRNLEYRFQVSNSADWTNFGASPKGKFEVKKEGNDLIRVEIRDRVSGLKQRTYRPYLVRQERRPTPPRIKLLTTPPFAAGDQIGFEVVILAEPSINKNDIKVRWDFDSDGTFDTPWQTDKKGYFVYGGGNLTSPTVSVQYPGGRTLTVRGVRVGQPARGEFDYARDVEKLTISGARVQAPIVEVSPGYKSPNQDTVFTFDASRTRVGSNSYLEFYFDGVKRYSNKLIVKHRFQSPGEHTVRVLNCINRSQPECRPTEINIEVDGSADSTGVGFFPEFTASELIAGVQQFRISENVYQAVVSSPIRFTANVRLTTTGARPKFEYRWDFDGDEVWDTPYSTQISSQYTYDRAGDFSPRLEVRDDKGNQALSTKKMLVLKNTKPIGRIRTQQWPVYNQDEVQFLVEAVDAQSNASQLETRWDFDGDGVWDTEFQRSRSQLWQFDESGDYEVTVQIRDPQKEVRTVARTIPVLTVPAPKLKVIVSHRTQAVGQGISLNATQSQGVGLQYEWKVVSDPYHPITRGPQASLRFTTPGERIICLRVIDEAGNIEQVEFPVNIVAELPKVVINSPKPEVDLQAGTTNLSANGIPEAISDFETADSDFVWSDYSLIDRPNWRLTGMRPGP